MPGSMQASKHWDLFCRVVDNFGDVGVCWRLAADLAARGVQVRLWIDDASALRWMAPAGFAGVDVRAFGDAARHGVAPGAVVVEAFGCDPPAAFVGRIGADTVWINLEYLSAEGWVERCHGLPSPQPGGQTKWFFFPGFTAATGGLLREPDALPAPNADPAALWARVGLQPAPGERRVSLFCYDNPALPSLLQRLGDAPTLLLATPGAAQAQLRQAGPLPANLRVAALPWLTQPDFDRLLQACDLNFVRGEDSLVRAVWAGSPFVWQAYPQHDAAHALKVQALLARLPPVDGLATLWQAWNGLGVAMPATLPPLPAWRAACGEFREVLTRQDDLTTQLMRFVGTKRAHC